MSTPSRKYEALETLREHMKPGTTVYTVLRHVSKSGMSRAIDVYTIEDNIPLRWSWSVADAIGASYSRKHEAVTIQGCGMDMGYHIVNSLSYALHGSKKTEENPTPGYTLRHQWI